MQISSKYHIPFWRVAPLFRLFVALSIGIICGHQLPVFSTYETLAVAGAAALLAVAGGWWWQRFPLRASLALLAGVILAGVLLLQSHQTQFHPGFIGRHYQPGHSMVATLTEPPLPKEKSYKATASIQLRDQQSLRKMAGQIIIYLQKTEKANNLDYGSRLVLVKPLQRIRNGGNPGGFNYEAYAARQQLFYQVYLKDDEYEVLPGKKGHWFQQRLFTWRSWVLRQITHFIPSSLENGVAQALLIGYRGDLDKNLVEAYANTGVVHIIAISGMHLGMIYALLLLLLQPLGSTYKMRVLKSVISIVIIWLFTLLTGAAPSISRAAVMFTMLAIGQLLHRSPSTYNTLSAAALLLLMANPYGLWDVGFQLSFAAVLSITIFYTPILQWWTPLFAPWRYLWQMIAVTLAAQILTLPLGVYHFHQFPMYFLLANLLAVPLSAIALYGLLVLLAISWWPAAASLLGTGCTYIIGWLNSFIVWVSQLPYTTIGAVQISMLQAVLMYSIIAGMAGWWLRRQPSYLVAGLTAGVIFMGFWASAKIKAAQQQQLIVYNVPQHTAIDWVQGQRAAFIGDAEAASPGFLQNFHLLPSRIFHQFQQQQTMLLDSMHNYRIQAGNHQIAVLRKGFDYRKSKPITTKILLVTGNPAGNPFRILPFIKCELIVLDGSNSRARIARWKSAADSLHLRLHNVAEQGAFVLNLTNRQTQ